MKGHIQVYATNINVEAQSDIMLATVSGFDISQIVQELDTTELIEALDANGGYLAMKQYVHEQEKEAKENWGE